MLFSFFIINVNVRAKRHKLTSYFGKFACYLFGIRFHAKCMKRGVTMIEFMYWEQSPALNVNIWNNHALINLCFIFLV